MAGETRRRGAPALPWPWRAGPALLALLIASAGAGGLSAPEYRAISAAVNAAARERATSPARSFADLDRARDLLDAADVGSSPLLGGLRTALSNARIAVGRSQTDLEAQVAQVNGFLRKALYDSTLEAVQQDSGAGAPGAALLAAELGVAAAERPALLTAARGSQVEAVRVRLERAVAAKLQGELAGVNPASRAGAYLAMARASGWFSVVQDSPRAGDLSGAAFVGALSSLARGDQAAFAGQLRDLRAGAARFAASAAEAASSPEKSRAEKSGTGQSRTGQPNTGQSGVGPVASAPAVPSAGLNALFVLLGLLAPYPLYLLNLAFGGRNSYWRAIGAALALLLLPVMLEGLAALGALLKGATGVAAFGALGKLSLLHNPLGGLAWALFAGLAIGLAIWGFRGLCAEFGLLGRRAADVPARHPTVEWDEEL